MFKRLADAIKYLRAEMHKGFYAPDKEYIETVIYFAEESQKQKLSNTEILMFVTGWQGGTINQLAQHLGVTAMDIADADYDRMQDLMRLAQSKRAALQNDVTDDEVSEAVEYLTEDGGRKDDYISYSEKLEILIKAATRKPDVITDQELMDLVRTTFKTGAGLSNVIADAHPNGVKIVRER